MTTNDVGFRRRDPGFVGQLEALAAVIEHGSYSRAASSLGLGNASAVRKRVAELGKRLGAESQQDPIALVVFESSLNRVVPTDAGVQVNEFSTDLSASIAHLADELRGTAEQSEIRVGAYPAHVVNCLAGAAREVTTRFPTRRFTWNVTDEHRADHGAELLRALKADELDVVVLPTKPRLPRRFEIAELYSWRLVVTGRGLPSTIGWPELLQLQLGVSGERHVSYKALRKAATAEGAKTRRALDKAIAVECESTTALLALAASDFVSAVVPSDAVPAALSRAHLDIDQRHVTGTYWISWRSRADSAPLRRFVGAALQRAEELVI